MTGGSSILAITRSFPPQRRQTSMSIANTRLRRCAQVRDRCRSVADGSLDSTALPPAAGRRSWYETHLLYRAATINLLERVEFSSIDAHGDEVIGEREATKLPPLSEAFARVDTDADKMISKKEFAAAQRWQSPGRHRRPARTWSGFYVPSSYWSRPD